MYLFFLDSLIVYVISCMMYVFTTKLQDKTDYRVSLRSITISAFFLLLTQAILNVRILTFYNVLSITAGFLWCVVIPMIKHFGYQNIRISFRQGGTVTVNCRNEIVSGIYIANFLSVLCLICINNIFTNLLYYIIFSILISIPCMYVAHYLIYGIPIQITAIKALSCTYWQETKEYLLQFIGLTKLLLIFISYVSLGLLYSYSAYGLGMYYESNLVSMAILFILCIVIINRVRRTDLFSMYQEVKCGIANENDYKNKQQERDKKIDIINVDESVFSKLQGTVIMIIGESETRDYMNAYHGNIEYDNTPWLKSMLKDKGFTLFEDAWSCFNTTEEVLKRALTQMSQYNDYKFIDSTSIIDVVKKIGYETYWFSNQGSLISPGNAEGLIASICDHVIGLSDSNVVEYDKSLIKLLNNVNPKKNNFIVLHIKGSHGRYNARYPQDWAKWPSNTEKDAYMNTVLYTDEFLKEVYTYAKNKLNLNAMVYFSDHGDNLKHGHYPELRSLDTVRIPMFIYVSDEYIEKFYNRLSNMKNNRHKSFSNDMIYNTVLGLLNINTSCYDQKEDITSEYYAYDKDNVVTFLGELTVADSCEIDNLSKHTNM